MIKSIQDLQELVDEYGFLPFFENDIKGFSIEEHTHPNLWFNDEIDGPWEWKSEMIMTKKYVYGKFFNRKAGFISLKWLPHFANVRRDGYDFDSRCDDGLVYFKDQELYEIIEKTRYITTKELKKEFNDKSYETIITRLMMQTYIVNTNFVYHFSKSGERYGWGIAEYGIPEKFLGKKAVRGAYKDDPLKSKEKIIKHIKRLFPEASEQAIWKIVIKGA